jgi:hypothetical protein
MESKKRVITMGMDENGIKGVKAISFVDFPAIESDFIALNTDKVWLQKVDEERRMVYGAALIPDKHIYRVNERTQEEYYIVFPTETVKAAAYAFMKQGNQHQATFMHEFAISGCTVVESWIKESDQDKSTHLGLNVPINTWCIGVKVDNDELWQLVKSGEVRGFSVEAFFDHLEDEFTEMAKMLEEIENVLKENL